MPAKPEPSTRVAGPSLEGLLRAGPPEEAGGRASASAAGSFATWRTDSITGPPGEGLEVHGKVGGIRAAVRIDAVRASPDHGTAFFTWVGVSRPAQADRPLGAGERRELLGALLNERRGLEERCESDRDLNRPLLEPLAQLRRAIALLLERMPAGPTGVVDLGDLAGAANE